jgi:hypothetical protein
LNTDLYSFAGGSNNQGANPVATPITLASGNISGSPTGTLLAGHEYEFFAKEELDTNVDIDPTSTGFTTITFTPVPEPATGIVFALAAAVGGSRRRSCGR